ncbi:MAG TPA: SAM-dependent methyltransferase [Lentisphaeria bacterium]|nr:MAG: methylase [Lentisphaerae bacterium GWF2_50_93]HCE45849.1 SAM-dependent methyltransferase [Lentisphaeria bacterium]
MPLSWNEINKRAIEFSNEWKDVHCERSESKSFWDSFFNVFGISRKRIATFEEPVKLIGDKHGFIDLFWKGTLLVEHKSKGKSLDKAYTQALDYFSGLKEYELPKYVLVSDFERFRLFDLEDGSENEFNLTELHKNIHLFGFIAGYRKQTYKDQDPVNIKAAELMGKLHDRLLASGYSGHQLEVLLVRILFCLFADDTGIFEKGTFTEFIEQVAVDGSDTGSKLAHLFQVLNTPESKRHNTLDERLSQFRYINGKLFEEPLPLASFDSEMRNALLECCYFDWSQISPAIFGSLFQSVMDPEKRRNIGAHYTSEKNILKVIKPLFLDELQSEFDGIRNVKTKLRVFHDKIAALKFFDPACGCGNFLVITYRELRLLEIEILKILHRYGDILDIKYFSKIDVDSFYGIEIEKFPARIAEVAMWLMDHQMNIKLSEAVGDYFVRLPLQKSANIANANALRIDWNFLMHGNYFDVSANVVNVGIVKEPRAHYDTINVLANKLNIVDEMEIQGQQDKHGVKFDYIFGNPPFIGKHLRNSQQDSDMDLVFQGMKNYKSLDYVTCWYLKAAQYIQNTKAKVAFVSTNSISQGEQPGILWNELFQKYHIKIHFGHRTFRWSNEARGMAHVYVVIIGFANFDTYRKHIYYYDKPDSEAHEKLASNINPYLVEMSDLVVLSRKKTISPVPEIIYGNKPVDDGNLILTDEEKKSLLESEPLCGKFIKPLISAKEYLNNLKRWCLWLVDFEPGELKQLPDIMLRVKKVREFRLASKKIPTQKIADTPALFAEIRQPKDNYVLIPLHTSENRKYIPFGFFSPDHIVHNSCACIPDATLYHFGVLSSEMHMIWMKYVCGRLKGDFRYSNDIVYNNFPWPDKPSGKNIKTVEQVAQRVLDARKEFPESSLADLYDPLSMPPALVKAHKELDKAVDLCYRPQAFTDEMKRIEYLFALYRKYIEPLLKKKK